MKIVILSDDFLPRSFGGGGIIASWQALELAKRGHEVSVITTVQEKGLEQKIFRDGLKNTERTKSRRCSYTQRPHSFVVLHT